jgi:hypothetical protein
MATRTAALGLACLLALPTGVGGCASYDEVARVQSPSGKIDAVLVETNGGATTSFRYGVHLVASGSAPAAPNRVAVLDGATRNETAYGTNLVWRGPTLLVVEFLDAKSAKIERAVSEIGGARVVVAIEEGVRDPSAPAGGMLYNLHRNGRPK